ncbi:hypothetical protein BKA57DRAFT_465782 [Linnemannia elongata]|nr:hypothetical protein BKA57DRAFT_465782 [Linnemannia elongata]
MSPSLGSFFQCPLAFFSSSYLPCYALPLPCHTITVNPYPLFSTCIFLFCHSLTLSVFASPYFLLLDHVQPPRPGQGRQREGEQKGGERK